MGNKTFDIVEYQITYTNMDDTMVTVNISTDRIDWTLEQYARNRDIKSYDIITYEVWDGIQYITESYIPGPDPKIIAEDDFDI